MRLIARKADELHFLQAEVIGGLCNKKKLI
jgi:hypothetical protein